MNPSVSQQVIDAATERDPASAAAEWQAEFRSDIESFINREAVEACIAYDVRERAPMQGVRYYGFVDPSGGSVDSMSLAVGHREDDIVVLDAMREAKPPFSPESAVAEFSELLKSYHVSKITGDVTRASGRASAFASTASLTSQRKSPSRTCIATYCPLSIAANSTCSTIRAS